MVALKHKLVGTLSDDQTALLEYDFGTADTCQLPTRARVQQAIQPRWPDCPCRQPRRWDWVHPRAESRDEHRRWSGWQDTVGLISSHLGCERVAGFDERPFGVQLPE